MAPIGRLRPLPRFGLFHFHAYEQRQQRRESAEQEHRPPAPALEQKEVAEGGQKVSQRVALLQQARKHAAQTRRDLLHGQRRANAPLPAHADSEKRAQNKERSISGRERGGDLDDGIKDEVGHQRRPATVTIGKQAEQKCADGPESERHRDR